MVKKILIIIKKIKIKVINCSVNEVIENDIDVYNQIRLMINAIEDRAFNREHLFDIFAYLSEKLQTHYSESDELILKKKLNLLKIHIILMIKNLNIIYYNK